MKACIWMLYPCLRIVLLYAASTLQLWDPKWTSIMRYLTAKIIFLFFVVNLFLSSSKFLVKISVTSTTLVMSLIRRHGIWGIVYRSGSKLTLQYSRCSRLSQLTLTQVVETNLDNFNWFEIIRKVQRDGRNNLTF